MTTAASTYAMLPYRRQGEIDYASLDFNAGEPVRKPDAMEQNLEQDEILGLLRAHLTGFNRRPDIFLDRDTNICYVPSNLNIRISPDIYVAFGVDARAIRPRRLYLPWEVGKPPDLAIEVASYSTGREDVNLKPGIYARIGVPEYWRFDPTGGRYHGHPLYGGLLSNGAYRAVDLTTEPDGILKGYSPALELSLAWDEGWPRFYDPATGTYLEGWRELWAARESNREALAAERAALQSERAAHAATQAAWQIERNARAAERARIRELEAELRRRQAED